ncbi:MAG: PAS domain S-box protein, partial [Chloroflexota bacterium]
MNERSHQHKGAFGAIRNLVKKRFPLFLSGLYLLERYSILFEKSPFALALSRMPENTIVSVNDAFLELFEFIRTEVIGKTSVELDIADAESQEKVGAELQARGRVQDFEVTRLTKTGRRLDLSLNLDWVTIGGEKYILTTIRDITERKRAEQALHQSEQRFRELFENMSSGVAVYEAVDAGQDFIFRDFNRAGERIENIRREQLIGKSVLEVFPGVKEFSLFELFQRVWKTGQPEHHPISLYKDERIVGWRENYVYKLPSGEIVAVYDDVTERMQAQQALEEYTRRLEVLAEIDRAILEARSVEQIARATLEHIRALVPVCRRASVAEFDPDLQSARLLSVHVNDETEIEAGHEVPLERFGDLAKLRAGQTHYVRDVRQAAFEEPVSQRLQIEGLLSYVNIPLIANGSLLGTLNIAAAE